MVTIHGHVYVYGAVMPSEVVSVRVSPRLIARLDELAGEQLRTRSNMAAAILAQALEPDTKDDRP
jgi:predicted transcriptional regulator